MLDKRCIALLDYLNKESLSDSYKVFDIEDIIASMPAQFGFDRDSIGECIRALSEREYISVKYQDEKEVCLLPLTKGRLVFENRIDNEISKRQAERRYFFYSFIGGVSGALLANIVFILMKIIGAI